MGIEKDVLIVNNDRKSFYPRAPEIANRRGGFVNKIGQERAGIP
jgi:hypothetical protein